MKNTIIFRSKLQARMKEAGESQSALAARFDIEQASLSRFLSGRGGLSGEYTLRLLPFVYPDKTEKLQTGADNAA